jgi:hypothetical protein
MSGILEVCLSKVWSRKFCCVFNGHLYWGYAPQKDVCEGAVSLNGVDVRIKHKRKRFVAEVFSPQKENIFSTKGPKGQTIAYVVCFLCECFCVRICVCVCVCPCVCLWACVCSVFLLLVSSIVSRVCFVLIAYICVVCMCVYVCVSARVLQSLSSHHLRCVTSRQSHSAILLG